MSMDADDPELRKEFYGKGPVIGTIGVPLYSDMLNLGMMLNIVNLDDDSTLALLAGYDDLKANELSSQYEKDKAYAISRILSTGINRAAYRHLPQILEGNIGWVIQSELGFYPTKEAKKKKKVLQEDISPELFQLINK